MENLNFPFIVKFYRTYKNPSHIFILEEFIHGKELNKLLRKFKVFSFPVTQFLIASIVLVIEYLHNLKIIYRDIKPENLILNSDVKIKELSTLSDYSFYGFMETFNNFCFFRKIIYDIYFYYFFIQNF